MEYLTVKEVAQLVRRNEETIRRMIRARKLDVKLDNNNRKQGYMISVDQLMDTWDISPEEVQRFVAERDAEQTAPPDKLPLGPEKPEKGFDAAGFGAEIGRSVASTLDQSVQRIAREMGRMARQNTEDGGKRDMNGMNGNDREHNGAQNGADERQTVFELDLSAAGAKVGEILGDAYEQIRRAVDQMSAAYTAAREQSGQRNQPYNAAEAARRARQERESSIRDSINSGARTAATCGDAGEPEQTEPCAAPASRPDEPAAEPMWAAAQPTPAPVIELFSNREEPEEEPEIDLSTINDAQHNASHQLLQAARRAVEERVRAANAQQEHAPAAFDMGAAPVAPAAPEADDAEDCADAARQAVTERLKAFASDDAEQKHGTPHGHVFSAQQQPAAERWHAAVAGDIERLAREQAAMNSAAPAPAAESAPEPVQMSDDSDAMQRRINSLEDQLSRMSAQLELLTKKLLGDK